MKAISLKELAKFSDQYIAVSEDNTRIIAANKNLELLQKELEKQNTENITINYIPPVDMVLSPLCQ